MSSSGRKVSRPTSPTDEQLARQASRLSLNEVAERESSSRSSTPKPTPSSTDSSMSDLGGHPRGMIGNPPKPFHGEPSKVRSFFQHCDLYFKMNSDKFKGDSVKIDFMSSFFEGRAEEWFRPFFHDYTQNKEDVQEDNTKIMFSTYDKFKKSVNSAFGGQNETREAERQIMSLKQTGSVQEYASRLRGLVATLGWSDSVTVPIFREGLKPTIKWELRKENLKKLSKIIEEA